MKKITKIDKVQNAAEKRQKLRVAAYCRVSTRSDEQIESLNIQKTHYEGYIASREDWQFAGLYFDEGIPIYFEKGNINTGSMESELFLTILSSMAEEESISISQNSKHQWTLYSVMNS